MTTIDSILKEFIQTFDIDRIKDRSTHKYLEGYEAEKRIADYLRDKLQTHLSPKEVSIDDTEQEQRRIQEDVEYNALNLK